MKSVVMVIQAFFPMIGGAETQCLQLSKSLKKRGMDVHVITERWNNLPSEDLVDGIPVKRLSRGGSRRLNSLCFVVAVFVYLLVHSKKYQVIHVHLAASHAIAAAVVGKILRKRVIVKIGGGNEIGEIALSRRTIFGKIKLWVLGFLKPQFVIVNAEQKKQLQGFGLENVPAILIPNGVDADLYHPLPADEKNRLREKSGWKGLVFLYTGRFSEGKVPIDVMETFLKGWSKARKKNADISLYLVGQGPLEQPYRNLIDQYNLQDSVTIMGARNNIAELYQAADVFVLPSLVEGLSNSLLEAMAAGLPVFASRVPGTVDLIQDNVQGYLYNLTSDEDIERCLTKFVDQRTQLTDFGKKARAVALKYAIDTTAEQYLSLYNGSVRHVTTEAS